MENRKSNTFEATITQVNPSIMDYTTISDWSPKKHHLALLEKHVGEIPGGKE